MRRLQKASGLLLRLFFILTLFPLILFTTASCTTAAHTGFSAKDTADAHALPANANAAENDKNTALNSDNADRTARTADSANTAETAKSAARSAAVAAAVNDKIDAASGEWQTIVPPVQCIRRTYKTIPLAYSLVRINLADNAIDITGTQPEKYGTGTVAAVSVSSWAKKKGTAVAINASPFAYTGCIFSNKRELRGIYVYEGHTVSEANAKYAALYFDKNKRAFIADSQNEAELSGARFAFGGFWTILDGANIIDGIPSSENGIIKKFKNIREARTAIGISADGLTLYILCVEKNLRSTGLSFTECAQILKNAGAVRALQMDGGHSVNLIVRRFPKLSIRGIRKAANCLGIVYRQ